MRFALLFLLCFPGVALRAEPLVIGSKNFTESYLLAEIAAQLLESHGIEVERRLGLNGTKISWPCATTRSTSTPNTPARYPR